MFLKKKNIRNIKEILSLNKMELKRIIVKLK